MQKPNTQIQKINVLALFSEDGKIIGFISKNGAVVEFYTASIASFDDIEELLKSMKNVEDKIEK